MNGSVKAMKISTLRHILAIEQILLTIATLFLFIEYLNKFGFEFSVTLAAITYSLFVWNQRDYALRLLEMDKRVAVVGLIAFQAGVLIVGYIFIGAFVLHPTERQYVFISRGVIAIVAMSVILHILMSRAAERDEA